MQDFNPDNLIPFQKEGAYSDTKAERRLDNENDARSFFLEVCERLVNVNEWKKYAGSFTADFQLCDDKGIEADRTVKMHDHFRINGPGPGTVAGHGYDWVQVEAFEKYEAPGQQLLCIRVRPVSNPTNTKEETAHFFTDDSTSSFIARRMGLVVSAEVHGRNEKANTDIDNLLDKARNLLAGAVAVTVYSKFQWKSLVEGLINYTAPK